MARVLLLAILLGSAGCASTTARTVFRDRDGGVVAIPENTDTFPDYNRDHALELIREHVGKDYEIVKEEEYVLGPVVKNQTRFTHRPILNWLLPWKLADTATTTSTSETKNETEYRIHYQKAAAKPADLPPLADGVPR